MPGLFERTIKLPANNREQRRAALAWGLSSVPIAYLEVLRLAAGVSFSWKDFAIRGGFVIGVLLAARLTQPYPLNGMFSIWPWSGMLIAGVGGAALLAYAISGAGWGAWVALAVFYILLLGLAQVWGDGQSALRRRSAEGLLVVAAGLVPVAVSQIESHFADEEFFIALQALALGGFWVLLLMVWRLLGQATAVPAPPGVRLSRRLGLYLVLTAGAGLAMTARTYQHSFYPSQAPAFEGVSAAVPFVCGEVAPDAQTFDGRDVFNRLLARVEANPFKGVPEYGMLALARGEDRWTQAFHVGLLQEAAQGLFAGPANSVKFGQYEAALRVYYYARVQAAFPDLFTPDEQERVRQWFTSLNRRTLTVEWVDWAYALAYSKWPEGPYENQENGAGLLALLESQKLSAADLSPTNRAYLERNPRGWVARFRNTDDAFIYQPEWLTNAFFQSLYTGQAPQANVQLSFEWLLLQALPDGAALRYNHPDVVSLAGVAYWGAHLLADARYVWLAGKALTDLEARGEYPFAQPGAEAVVDQLGRSPTQGSCLLYGNSGLPNQAGPLAPDKIVFRDGWSDESTYLLLNLRFAGWHRYKATNTLTLLYQGGPLVTEELSGASFTWLPVGRSLFRDKRLPRENLNGLVIERTGMSAVLYALTGIGGPWAQDPPYYARVERFETGAHVDIGRTVVEGWRGWQHARTVYFYHDGLVVVVDDASGPTAGRAALIWHVTGEGLAQGQRLPLRQGANPAEMVLLPIGGGKEQASEMHLNQEGSSGAQVTYSPPAKGRLGLITVFLMKEWVGAKASIIRGEEGLTLQMVKGAKRIDVSIVPGDHPP